MLKEGPAHRERCGRRKAATEQCMSESSLPIDPRLPTTLGGLAVFIVVFSYGMFIQNMTPATSLAGWFDDDGTALYCYARLDTRFGLRDMIFGERVRDPDDVAFNCSHHWGDLHRYPNIAPHHEGHLGFTEVTMEPVFGEPGCVELSGDLWRLRECSAPGWE